MKFWTAQVERRTKKLLAGMPIEPNFCCYHDKKPNTKAYRHLLAVFNSKNAVNAHGLIFGYESEDIESIRSAIRKVGEPFGAFFPDRPMLEVDVPDYIPTLVVDFYRFSDLIYGFGDGEPFLTVAKRDLLEPNGKEFELPVTHIQIIKPEWAVAVHGAISMG